MTTTTTTTAIITDALRAAQAARSLFDRIATADTLTLWDMIGASENLRGVRAPATALLTAAANPARGLEARLAEELGTGYTASDLTTLFGSVEVLGQTYGDAVEAMHARGDAIEQFLSPSGDRQYRNRNYSGADIAAIQAAAIAVRDALQPFA